MGCDIHSICEVFNEKTHKWKETDEIFPTDSYDQVCGIFKQYAPFSIRNYSVFGFLANVRNYSHSEYLAEPRGLPEDWIVDDNDLGYYHSHSWLLLSELLAFDYTKVFWNRRVTKMVGNCLSGAGLADEGEGTHESYTEFLGPAFFETLEIMKTLGPPDKVRVVFYFDH